MFGNPARIEADIERNSAFNHVDTWIFDLDNTLYPAGSNLFGQIDERIRSYVARELGLSLEDAHKLQKDLYRRYGTSLRGLMSEYGMAPGGFLDYVHDIDHSVLAADPRLSAAVAALPGRRFIMTNGTRSHAEKTAARLGLVEHIDGIFDIVAAELVPKPSPEAYRTFFSLHGVEPNRAAMFEDISRNLAVPHERGSRTVLVVPEGAPVRFADAGDETGGAASYVDFVTDDLAGFLAGLTAGGMTISRDRR